MNQRTIDLLHERSVLNHFKMMGYSSRQLEILDENDFADQSETENYWYYSGPNDEVTRDFCRELLRIDKFYRESDLNSLSRKVGYNVLEHQGGFNCRHSWKRVRAKMKQDSPSRGQIDRAAVKQDSGIQKYFPFMLPFPKQY